MRGRPGLHLNNATLDVALFSATCEHGPRGFVRSEIFRAVDMEQFSQPRARTIYARFDGSDRAAADPGCFLV